jgi:hypothetical protein
LITNARAAAQHALLDIQTAYLVGDEMEAVRIAGSVLNYIASNGEMYKKQWGHFRAIRKDDWDIAETGE